MNKKKINRIRRGKKTRLSVRQQNKASLLINKTPRHIYAQLIDTTGTKILADVSTLQKSIKEGLNYTGNIEAAIKVGNVIANKAKEFGISEIAFDRNGFRYHGRVKALAEAAREAGLIF